MELLFTAWLVATAVTASLFVLAVVCQTVWRGVARLVAGVSRSRSAAPAAQPSRAGAHATA